MGLRPLESGRILLDGEDLASRSTAEIRNAGLGFVPEDRHEQGLVLGMTLGVRIRLVCPTEGHVDVVGTDPA